MTFLFIRVSIQLENVHGTMSVGIQPDQYQQRGSQPGTEIRDQDGRILPDAFKAIRDAVLNSNIHARTESGNERLDTDEGKCNSLTETPMEKSEENISVSTVLPGIENLKKREIVEPVKIDFTTEKDEFTHQSVTPEKNEDPSVDSAEELDWSPKIEQDAESEMNAEMKMRTSVESDDAEINTKMSGESDDAGINTKIREFNEKQNNDNSFELDDAIFCTTPWQLFKAISQAVFNLLNAIYQRSIFY